MFLKPLTLQTCFSCPHACIGMLAFVGSQNRSDHTALWLVDITVYKTGVVRIGHQCGVWVEEKATGSDSSTSFILHGTLKNWQTCHRVPRCWPHSSICRSPGQGIGRPGLRVTSHTTDRISGTWITFFSPYLGAGADSASENGRDIIQDGGRKRNWLLLLNGGSKTYRILLSPSQVYRLPPTKPTICATYLMKLLGFLIAIIFLWLNDGKCL